MVIVGEELRYYFNVGPIVALVDKLLILGSDLAEQLCLF
jgi:hypothetical protein